jgi:hypothetical protein
MLILLGKKKLPAYSFWQVIRGDEIFAGFGISIYMRIPQLASKIIGIFLIEFECLSCF